MENKNVIAMYDVRGIQDYIFRTPKLKHAIGASAIVESIIEDALKDAVNRYNDKSISYDLSWEQIEYKGQDKDIQVLYIGGGNAVVLFKDKELYLAITKLMSKYVLENTYSLQLAATCVDKTDIYQDDYRRLNKKMTEVKADMPESKPVGAFPIMQMELSTGLPVNNDDQSREVELKLIAEKKRRKNTKTEAKIFDNIIEEKGNDSNIAVVHIDGNNMGLRIRELLENGSTNDIGNYDKNSYVDAVKLMRKISYNINHSYKDTFNEMMEIFNKNKDYLIIPVLIAGDDITYVCKAKAALASIEYFVEHIKGKTMTGNSDDVDKYGFSVCGGIAYIHSHFPFSIAYQVAEACCESAKDRAKANLKGNNMVGNFFDFQFCKNIQTLDMDTIRQNQYITSSNENLICRPYEIGGDDNLYYSYNRLKKYLDAFIPLSENKDNGQKDKKLPRTHAKKLRNVYSLGYNQVDSFVRFLASRKWIFPDGDLEAYVLENNKKIAKYYDALELMDVYEPLNLVINAKGEELNEEL